MAEAPTRRVTRVSGPPVASDQGSRTRTTEPLPTARTRRRYRVVVGALTALAVFFAVGLLVWDNPMPYGSEGFLRIAEMRVTTVVVMLVVACCQALATVSFQTVTTNRIVTPSLMGFEALYVAVQTAAVYFLGVAGVGLLDGVAQFLMMIVLMVGLSVSLYSWLLSGRRADIHTMLLIGIIIGGGLGSVAAFMQRLLTPSEFDVLTARMFGSMAKAEGEYLPFALVLCALAGGALWWRSRRLDVIALGRDAATNLGLDHRREVRRVLLLVSILMAVSTALVGPMTFLGFLVATLAYQAADTYDHRRVLPVAALIGFVVLAGAYFVMKHLFYAEGAVSILIELVGGSVFLVVILRKGRL